MLIKFLRRLLSKDTKKVVNERETCPEEQEQPNDDEVTRIVKNYIKNFSGLEKCKYLYFGKGISEQKLESARKKYAYYDPTKERPLLLIETKMFGIWTDVVIFLTNTNMYFAGYADIDSKGWYDAPVPEGKGLIPLNDLKNALDRGEYYLEFDDSCLKIVGYILVPVVCYVGHDNVRFLKGLFTLLISLPLDVLQKE